MGISGLLPLLKPVTHDVHVREYRGKKVAIDTYSWLHKGAFACSRQICLGLSSEKCIDYCMDRVRMLLHYGIIPILVFDGGQLPMKLEEDSSREKKRKENLDKAIQLERQGKQREAFDHFRKAVDITPAIALELIKVLQKECIEYIVSPYEADAQLAYLSHNKIVDFIISEDSDLIAYGCPHVLYKMDKSGLGVEIKFENVFKNENLSFQNFTPEMFLQMCIFSGCDYLPSLRGIGLKRAHNLINKHKNYTKAIQSLAFEGVNIPSDYESDFEKAILTYKHQRVFDPILKQIVHLNPWNDHGFSDTSFLGPELEPSIACAIARGDMNPITLQPFQYELCNTLLISNKIENSNHTKDTFISSSKNKISNYFAKKNAITIPKNSEAMKKFQSPRKVKVLNEKSNSEKIKNQSQSQNTIQPNSNNPIPSQDESQSQSQNTPVIHSNSNDSTHMSNIDKIKKTKNVKTEKIMNSSNSAPSLNSMDNINVIKNMNVCEKIKKGGNGISGDKTIAMNEDLFSSDSFHTPLRNDHEFSKFSFNTNEDSGKFASKGRKRLMQFDNSSERFLKTNNPSNSGESISIHSSVSNQIKSKKIKKSTIKQSKYESKNSASFHSSNKHSSSSLMCSEEMTEETKEEDGDEEKEKKKKVDGKDEVRKHGKVSDSNFENEHKDYAFQDRGIMDFAVADDGNSQILDSLLSQPCNLHKSQRKNQNENQEDGVKTTAPKMDSKSVIEKKEQTKKSNFFSHWKGKGADEEQDKVEEKYIAAGADEENAEHDDAYSALSPSIQSSFSTNLSHLRSYCTMGQKALDNFAHGVNKGKVRFGIKAGSRVSGLRPIQNETRNKLSLILNNKTVPCMNPPFTSFAFKR